MISPKFSVKSHINVQWSVLYTQIKSFLLSKKINLDGRDRPATMKNESCQTQKMCLHVIVLDWSTELNVK